MDDSPNSWYNNLMVFFYIPTWLNIFCCQPMFTVSLSLTPCFMRSFISTSSPAGLLVVSPDPATGTRLEDVIRSNLTLKYNNIHFKNYVLSSDIKNFKGNISAVILCVAFIGSMRAKVLCILQTIKWIRECFVQEVN